MPNEAVAGAVYNLIREIFSVPSWLEHLLQHAGRLSEMDTVAAALAFSDPPAYADHVLPP